MYNKIIQALEPLEIELEFKVYEGEAEEYIIFDIISESDTSFADDTNLEIMYFITINYWFKSKKNLNRHIEIKNIMKKNGFTLDGSIKSLDGKGINGKSLDFIYTKLEERR